MEFGTNCFSPWSPFPAWWILIDFCIVIYRVARGSVRLLYLAVPSLRP